MYRLMDHWLSRMSLGYRTLSYLCLWILWGRSYPITDSTFTGLLQSPTHQTHTDPPPAKSLFAFWAGSFWIAFSAWDFYHDFAYLIYRCIVACSVRTGSEGVTFLWAAVSVVWTFRQNLSRAMKLKKPGCYDNYSIQPQDPWADYSNYSTASSLWSLIWRERPCARSFSGPFRTWTSCYSTTWSKSGQCHTDLVWE